MKHRIHLLLIPYLFFTLFYCKSILADSFSTWPKTPYSAICTDTANGLIFYTNGDIIYVLDNTLTEQSKIRISSNNGDYGFEGVQSIFYYDNKLYAALGYQGLQIINVTDPINPGVPVLYNTENNITTTNYGNSVFASDVFVNADKIYLADYFFGIRAVNHNLSIDTSNTGFKNDALFRVSVSGTYAYVLDQGGGMGIVQDLGQSSQTKLGAISIPGSLIGFSGAHDMAFNGNYAYISNIQLGKIHVVDIDQPNYTELSEIHTFSPGGNPQGLHINKNRLYITNAQSMMEIIDIDSTSPLYRTSLGFVAGFGAHDVYANENDAYIADYEHGLRQVDVSVPANITVTNSFAAPVNIDSVFVKGKYGYALSSNGIEEGLRIFLLQDENGITLQSFKATPGSAKDIYVSGFYAYIADGANGLQILDISVPTELGALVQLNTTGDAQGIHVNGDYAYVANGVDLTIVDVSSTSSPQIVSQIATSGDTRNVYIDGSYVYIADGSAGLKISDISNPVSPGPVVSFDTSGIVNDVYVKNGFAFVADGNGGLKIIKIFDSSGNISPTLTSTYDPGGNAVSINCSGDDIYLGLGNDGYEIVDVVDRDNPKTINSVLTNGVIPSVHISGDLGLFARGSEGVYLFTPYDQSDTPEPANWGSSDKACFTGLVSGNNLSGKFYSGSLFGIAIFSILLGLYVIITPKTFRE